MIAINVSRETLRISGVSENPHQLRVICHNASSVFRYDKNIDYETQQNGTV